MVLTGEPLRPGDPARLGPFSLISRIGAGGMGQVYLGRDPSGRFAAVKVAHSGLAADPSFRVRFAREIETAAAVNAPWTARVLDADPRARTPWLASEFVAGPGLDQVVEKSGPMAPRALGILAARLAQAVAGLHANGVVHRDLKPSNVLLADDGPRLIDFGIALIADATKITHTGGVVGTPAYMSPEQALGEDPGAASDVFSLASVIVFAATGLGPFGTSDSPVAMLIRVADAEPDLRRVPEPLRGALAPCFAKHPGARPSAAELAARLAPFDPAPAPQPVASTPAYRPRRPFPWLRLAISAVSVAVVVTLVLVLVRPWEATPPPGPTGTPVAEGTLPGQPVAPASPAKEIGAPLTIGESPEALAVSPDGTRVYTGNRDGVTIVDTTTGGLTNLALPGSVQDIAVHPDGSKAYISLLSGFVAVFDPATNATTNIGVQELPGAISITPDGKLVHVVNAMSNSVSVIDTATNAVVQTVAVDPSPQTAALTPDGTLLYIWSQESKRFSVLDTATQNIVGHVTADGSDGIVMAPDGKRAYAFGGLGDITVLDPTRIAVIGHINIPYDTGRIEGLTVSANSRYVFVGLQSDTGSLVRVLDAASTFTVEDAPISAEPGRLEATPDRLYVISTYNSETSEPGKTMLTLDIGGYR